jgi:hypothetical protein
MNKFNPLVNNELVSVLPQSGPSLVYSLYWDAMYELMHLIGIMVSNRVNKCLAGVSCPHFLLYLGQV